MTDFEIPDLVEDIAHGKWLEGVTMADYNLWPYIRASEMKSARVGPHMVLHSREAERGTEPRHFRIGRAVHGLMDGSFSTEFDELPPGVTRRHKAYRELQEERPGVTFLDDNDLRDTYGAYNSLRENEDVQELLARPGLLLEPSMVFGDRKLRPDAWAPGLSVNWKTMADQPTARRFPFEAKKFGYDLSAAFYELVYRGAGLGTHEHYLPVVSYTAPYTSMVFRVGDFTMAAAIEEVQDLLEVVRNAEAANVWPGPRGVFEL